MTDKPPMFLDHGSDSFLSEVGQIMRITTIKINNYPKHSLRHERVRIFFRAVIPDGRERTFTSIANGRSYGECLRKIREDIRMETGR